MHIIVRIPRSSGSEIASSSDEQFHALLQLHAVFLAVPQSVKELVG
jgi:hypothetical protein